MKKPPRVYTDEERAIARAEYDAELAWVKAHASDKPAHPDWRRRAGRPWAQMNRPDVFSAEEIATARAEFDAQNAWAEAEVAKHEAEHPDERPKPIFTIKFDMGDLMATARKHAHKGD
jgi:hypothetical protein